MLLYNVRPPLTTPCSSSATSMQDTPTGISFLTRRDRPFADPPRMRTFPSSTRYSTDPPPTQEHPRCWISHCATHQNSWPTSKSTKTPCSCLTTFHCSPPFDP